MIIMGDLNGDLGNSLGDKGCYAPNDRGLRLLDFANYLNLCPINLLSICSGPLETFVSHCGRFKSTIDYILLPNCLHDSIVSCKTFEQTIENTSDHLPIQLKINFCDNSCTALSSDNFSEMAAKSVKVRWSNYSTETISTLYATSVANEFENMSPDDYNRLADSAVLIKDFLLKHSAPLVKPTRKNKKCGKVIKLPEDVKKARSRGNIAFNSWKLLNYPLEGDIHETYRASRKEYRKKLRIFLNQCEADKITKLCNAAESNGKLFWKLMKRQRSSSQMSAFVVNGELLTDKNKIRDMWADHFEALVSPSEIETFDKDFFNKVSDSVRESLFSFSTDPGGVLSEPLEYKEIAHVCSTLKLGVSGVEIDYEHIRFAGPPFWKLLFQLYQTFFNNFSVCDSLLTGVILPLFKGKGAKANNKDNYRGITLFPTLCKFDEMVLLNVWKNLRNSRDSFQIWNSASKKGLAVLKPVLLFWNP